MARWTIILWFVGAISRAVYAKKLKEECTRYESNGERTLMIGNLILAPILAGIGLKFVMFLPVVLSKIALLGVLSFLSSNLSLLVSAVTGVRSFLFEDARMTEDHDYQKIPYENSDEKSSNAHRQQSPHRYRVVQDTSGMEASHTDYDTRHALRNEYRPSKKRFRPFVLLGKIKDVVKDHFRRSNDRGQGYDDKEHLDTKNYPKRNPHILSLESNKHGVRSNQRDYFSPDENLYILQPGSIDWSVKKNLTAVRASRPRTNLEHLIDAELEIAPGPSAVELGEHSSKDSGRINDSEVGSSYFVNDFEDAGDDTDYIQHDNISN